MDATQDGGFKLRTRMVLFTSEGGAKAICPSCKTNVDVPYIGLTGELPEALPKTKIVVSP